jgi:sigma-B regulation protein RsbU (phosphoserine phosphatase)
MRDGLSFHTPPSGGYGYRVANLTSISAKQISLVLEVSRALAVVLELDSLLPMMAEAACDLLHCQRASVWLHDPKPRQLRTRVALRSEEIVVADSAGVVGSAFTQNVVLNISNPYKDPRFNPEADRRNNFVTESLLAAPMLDLSARPVGVIQAINKLGGPFTAGDEALIRLLADQAAVAIQRQRLHESAARAEVMRREMNIARSVQLALIPALAPEIPGLVADGWTKPASMTGGDCYDLWRLADGRLAVLVADASGHGIGPAMVVSQVRAMVRLLCEPIGGQACESDPTTILARINRRLEIDLSPGQFVTAFLAFVSSNGEMSWASAGHGPFLVKRSATSPVECLWGGTGMPLGIMPDCFEIAETSIEPLKLEPGGTLLVMSDGVFEAFNPSGTEFGVPRIIQVLKRNWASPGELIAEVRKSVEAWHLRDDPKDDQTLVAVQRV